MDESCVQGARSVTNGIPMRSVGTIIAVIETLFLREEILSVSPVCQSTNCTRLGSIASALTSSSASVTGSLKRRRPALPGFR